jgi:hypothetical protein
MIDFTLTEILTGLDLSDEAQFAGAIARPKLIRTDEPLETDISFRERFAFLALNDPQWLVAIGRELDAIGALHGLIRHGYRWETSQAPAEKPE